MSSLFKILDKAELAKKFVLYMNSCCTEECVKGLHDGKLQCDCGDTGMFEWTWDVDEDTSVNVSKNKKEVVFHPVYSSGTAALRGCLAFEKNLHYYWEVKMMSTLYGTDIMVGVGTSKIRIPDWKYRFFSLLGSDENSWGYSYNGTLQHNNVTRKYGSKFGLGSLVGVHLDMCRGTLEYYLNRKPLGVAFIGLKSKEIFPMICSTAAHSSMYMTCAISMKSSLQLKCLQCISKNPVLTKEFNSIPGLVRIYQRQFFWLLPQQSSTRTSESSGAPAVTTNRSTASPYFLRPKAKKTRYV